MKRPKSTDRVADDVLRELGEAVAVWRGGGAGELCCQRRPSGAGSGGPIDQSPKTRIATRTSPETSELTAKR